MDKKNIDIEQLLRTDFSSESNSKEELLHRLILKINNTHEEAEGDQYFMNKLKFRKKLFKPAVALGAMALLFFGFSMTSYGEELYTTIKEIFVGKYAHYSVSEINSTEKPEDRDYTIPESLEGKLYDDEGNVLEALKENTRIYDNKGQELTLSVKIYTDENGNTIEEIEALTAEEKAAQREMNMTSFSDPEKAREYLNFDFSLPSYMPEGYRFYQMMLFNDESGTPVKDSDYAYAYFTNGDHTKDLYLQLRHMNESTAFSADLGDIEEIEINGHTAVKGQKFVDVEINGVMYFFASVDSGISTDELVKMAETIQ
ncbi:DUF4367 domain-containing protein [Anaeropeptidivorans aminofermentans]|uniref:DUF4367 domain-containing protein n=1 Tax=Anaeropeptidivorans aminofermentans TaxID=2934315 RepID=UPI00202490D8|nr:DUF4367 domain-containing protein [Anaeropeptidivorans aminofermentans]